MTYQFWQAFEKRAVSGYKYYQALKGRLKSTARAAKSHHDSAYRVADNAVGRVLKAVDYDTAKLKKIRATDINQHMSLRSRGHK